MLLFLSTTGIFRIIPVGKWLVRNPHVEAIWKGNVALLRGLTITMVINHLQTRMILQADRYMTAGIPTINHQRKSRFPRSQKAEFSWGPKDYWCFETKSIWEKIKFATIDSCWTIWKLFKLNLPARWMYYSICIDSDMSFYIPASSQRCCLNPHGWCFLAPLPIHPALLERSFHKKGTALQGLTSRFYPNRTALICNYKVGLLVHKWSYNPYKRPKYTWLSLRLSPYQWGIITPCITGFFWFPAKSPPFMTDMTDPQDAMTLLLPLRQRLRRGGGTYRAHDASMVDCLVYLPIHGWLKFMGISKIPYIDVGKSR